MPKFKLNGAKAQEQKTGFEPYDGPIPTRDGFYRGIIKVMKHGLNTGSGSEGFQITLELAAAPGDPKGHAQFDGYPMFSRSIITSSADGNALKEGAQRNLDNLLAALGTGDDPDVVLAEGDSDKLDVKKIGKVNPIGRAVNIDLRMKMYEGERRPEVGGIYKYKEIDAEPTGTGRTSVLDDEDESDLLDEEEVEEVEETEEVEDEADEYDARAEELDGLGIPALKKIAKELEIAISGTKPKLIERILEAEFAEESEDEDEEEPDDEADEAEDEAEDDEAEDDEEEEDEDEAAKAERVAELADFDRAALKKVLKEIAPDFTVLKRHTDDQLRDQIVAVEFEDDLPF